MRQFISIVEGVDDASLAHTFSAKVKETAQKIGDQEYTIRAGWNNEWAKLLSVVIQEVKKEHESLQNDEKFYNPEHVEVPFSIKNSIPRSLEIMWDKVIYPLLNQALVDIGYDKNEYRKHHPYVELSDEKDLREAENDMVRAIQRKGLFDLNSMIEVCNEIDWFSDAIKRYPDHGLRVCSPSTQEFIVRVLPLMLIIAKLYAGK